MNRESQGKPSGDRGAKLRVLVYSHDTFGLGHLRRCLKITRALKGRFPDLSILLVTGSPQVHRYRIPVGIDYVKLPAVRKTADEQYEPRQAGMTFERILNLRSHLLLDTVKEFQPHVLLVDHSPLGMKDEMRPALEWLRAESRETVTVLGLRDIIDEPEKIIAQWRRQSMYSLLDSNYDHILIYGSPLVFDPLAAYEFTPALAAKTRYCGYITEPGDPGRNGHSPRGAGERRFVLVTIGGGDGAGEAVLGTYIDMLKRYRGEIDFDSLIITGPFLSEEMWRSIRAGARGLPVAIKRFVTETRPYLRKSDLVISTGGYNTTSEILTFAPRALIIPRIMYRNEQLLRARRFCELGLTSFLHPDETTPEKLLAIIRRELAGAGRPLAEARKSGQISLDGAAILTEHFGSLFSQITNGGKRHDAADTG